MLPKLPLDDRTYAEIVQQSRRLIPKHVPEWTDENAHDPGMTMLELFAWLTEMQRYYISRVPDGNQRRFLDLLGAAPADAESARALIQFSNVERATTIVPGTKLLAGDQTFETEEAVTLRPLRLDRIVCRTELESNDVTASNDHLHIAFYPFGTGAKEGSRLYISFDRELVPGEPVSLTFKLLQAAGEREDSFDPGGIAGRELVTPSARLSWKAYCWDSEAGKAVWMPLAVLADGTAHFTWSGTVTVAPSAGMLPVTVHPASDRPRYWICCTVEEEGYELPPRIRSLMLHTTRVTQRDTLCEYADKETSGSPGEAVEVQSFLALHGRIRVQTAMPGGRWRELSPESYRIERDLAAGKVRIWPDREALRQAGAVAEDGVSHRIAEPGPGASGQGTPGDALSDAPGQGTPGAAPSDAPGQGASGAALSDASGQGASGAAPSDASGQGTPGDALSDVPGQGTPGAAPSDALAAAPGEVRSPDEDGPVLASAPLIFRVIAGVPEFDRYRVVGRSNGLPYQTFELYDLPCKKRSALGLQVGSAADDGSLLWEDWTAVEDFDRSGPGDRHYVYDPSKRIIRFGNGERGAIPPAGADGNIVLAACVLGGGERGNVKPGLIAEWAHEAGRSLGIEVSNPFYATGGAEAETLAEALMRAQSELKRPFRAVTEGDYESLALGTPGVRVARVKAIPLYRPGLADYPRETEPGQLSLVVVPHSLERTPQPSPGFLGTVKRHLEARRLIGTELHVIPPVYIKVTVHATIVMEPAFADDFAKLEGLLRGLLRPLDGERGEKGWPFGRTVYKGDIYNTLAKGSGVLFVQDLWLDAEGAHVSKSAGGDLLLPPHGLVYSGEHQLELISRTRL